MGILSALVIAGQNQKEEVVIFTDSGAAVQAVQGCRWDSHPTVSAIGREMIRLSTRGKRIKLAWIPSHVGIPGNEKVDKLATDGRSAPTNGHLDNINTPAEKISSVKVKWKNKVLHDCTSKTTNRAAALRWSMGPLPWHRHRKREIQVALFRLRSGHNKLNHFIGGFDPDTPQRCPHGCSQNENSEHVLIVCTHYDAARSPLRQYFDANKIVLDWPSVVGLNRQLTPSTQKRIQNLLVAFLLETDLISRV